MKLHVLIPTSKPEVLRHAIWKSVLEVPLPTQMVIFRREDAVIRHARVFQTTLDPAELGAAESESILLIEVWEDLGVDNHVDFCMQGWRLVLASEFLQAQTAPPVGNWPAIVEFLRLREDEW